MSKINLARCTLIGVVIFALILGLLMFIMYPNNGTVSAQVEESTFVMLEDANLHDVGWFYKILDKEENIICYVHNGGLQCFKRE